MRILKNIVKKLGVEDENTEYFDLNEQLRAKLVDIIWNESYKDLYHNSLLPFTKENPLEVQYGILTYLMDLLYEYEEIDDYEVCDIVLRLIKITEHKIQEIEKDYANSK